MRNEITPATVFTIFDAPGLNPITVVMQDFGGGQGRLILECWGKAWSAYWGAMGCTLLQFVAGAHADYITNRMAQNTSNKRNDARNYAYLLRIVGALQIALRDPELAAADRVPPAQTASTNKG